MACRFTASSNESGSQGYGQVLRSSQDEHEDRPVPDGLVTAEYTAKMSSPASALDNELPIGLGTGVPLSGLRSDSSLCGNRVSTAYPPSQLAHASGYGGLWLHRSGRERITAKEFRYVCASLYRTPPCAR